MSLLQQSAPDFTLQDSTHQNVSLSDHRGTPVLLLFFPLAFTSVCTAELCGVRDNWNQYARLNATVFGISVDSASTLARFKEDSTLPFELLSDFNKEVSTAYGALYADFYGMRGVSKRAAFVIDAGGVVQYEEVLEDAGSQPDFAKIAEALQKTKS